MIRRPALALALAAASLAADAAPVDVHPSVMRLPRLAPGQELPMTADEWKNGAVRMPFVTGGEPGVAQRIDDALFLEHLGLPAPPAPAASFTPPADKLPEGTSSLDFRSLVAGRLLVVTITGEYCGAYCEEGTQTALFDLRDGRAVAMADLLTPAGETALAARADAQRRQAYEAQLRDLRQQKAALGKHPKPQDLEDVEQRIALNEACLEHARSTPTTRAALEAVPPFVDREGGLAVTQPRCSNHAERALDDVDQVVTRVAAAELERWLTPYGRGVLRGEGDAAPPPRFDRQVLRGRLGPAAITLRLGEIYDDGSFGGVYFYDRYRRPIELEGKRKGGVLEATEKTDSRAVLRLQPRGAGLAGTWTDKGGKSLPVTLE